MNKIQVFKNKEFGEIRTVYEKENDQVWFVARDLSKQLGYKSIERMYDHVDKEDKKEINPQVKHLQGSCGNGVSLESNPNIFRMMLINESGLYSAIFGSQLPSAKKFKRWVTSEVLPSIRKHGGYLTEKKIEEVLTNPDTIIQLATKLKNEMERSKQLKLENNKKNQLIGELKPKADYTDTILKNKGLVTITQIAKDYGLSGREMNKILHKLKIQYKQSEQWLLYSQHHGKGYTHSETIDITRADGTRDIKMNTKWTQKGRLFLYNKLKEHGYIPKIEIEEKEAM